MQSQTPPRARRVHDAQLKAKVLAECRQPGASVSAVALAHGLNANLVRNWLHGRGLRRAGLQGHEAVRPRPVTPVQFVALSVAEPLAEPVQPPQASCVEVELRRGASQVTVRWPSTQAAQCAAWLRDLTDVVLGTTASTP